MKFPVKFLIGVLAVVIGITGIIVCLVAQGSSEKGLIADYISAINDGDLEAMSKYAPSLSGMLGGNYDNLDALEGESDPVKQALDESCLPCPSEAVKVNCVELLGCSVNKEEDILTGITSVGSAQVNVLIKVEYVDADDEVQSKIYSDKLWLANQGNQYVIVEY